MKRNLNEQIARIQGLNNPDIKPEKILSEENVKYFIQSLKNTLQRFSKYGIPISKRFNIGVKSIQKALIYLGYSLPKYGADGYYGNETDIAIKKFIESEKQVQIPLRRLNEDASALRSTLSSLGYTEKGSEIDNGGKLDSRISGIAAQILKDFKETTPDVKVKVTGGNDAYHHRVNYKSLHTSGLALDFTINPYNSETSKAFINSIARVKRMNPGLSFRDEYANPSKGATGGHFHIQLNAPSKITNQKKARVQISPLVINRLIDKIVAKSKTESKAQGEEKPTISSIITKLDLNKPEDVQTYQRIADLFIQKRKSNPLGISGGMIAQAAKSAFDNYGKFVPPELSLSQLAIEGGVGNPNKNIRPVRTKNPYNVGNTDGGKNRNFSNVQNAINTYFNLIAKNYVGEDNDVSDLFINFTNGAGNRYASAKGYENLLGRVAKGVNRISQQVINTNNA